MTPIPSLKTIFVPIPFLLILLTLLRGTSSAQHWSLEERLVITDVIIVDVRTGDIRPDQVVVVERNKIIAAGSRKDTRYPRNAPTVNAKGEYLIPGLWDMHVQALRNSI
jgi:imidazolonepropionase-like amidohydrolase